MVALGSGAAALISGVPSSKQKFREGSVYVRLQVGQRFIMFQVVQSSTFRLPVKATAASSSLNSKQKFAGAQARIGFPQRPQNFVPAG